jgi:hypothetical protein
MWFASWIEAVFPTHRKMRDEWGTRQKQIPFGNDK